MVEDDEADGDAEDDQAEEMQEQNDAPDIVAEQDDDQAAGSDDLVLPALPAQTAAPQARILLKVLSVFSNIIDPPSHSLSRAWIRHLLRCIFRVLPASRCHEKSSLCKSTNRT
jgi:hypothetical protein